MSPIYTKEDENHPRATCARRFAYEASAAYEACSVSRRLRMLLMNEAASHGDLYVNINLKQMSQHGSG